MGFNREDVERRLDRRRARGACHIADTDLRAALAEIERLEADIASMQRQAIIDYDKRHGAELRAEQAEATVAKLTQTIRELWPQVLGETGESLVSRLVTRAEQAEARATEEHNKRVVAEEGLRMMTENAKSLRIYYERLTEALRKIEAESEQQFSRDIAAAALREEA